MSDFNYSPSEAQMVSRLASRILTSHPELGVQECFRLSRECLAESQRHGHNPTSGRPAFNLDYATLEAAVLAVTKGAQRFAKKADVAKELGVAVRTLEKKIKEQSAQPAKTAQGFIYV